MVFSKFPVISRNLPVINLVIACSALGFQICVLYPWHLIIDKSHKDLIVKMEEQEKRITNMTENKGNNSTDLPPIQSVEKSNIVLPPFNPFVRK